ncbi:MAG TPA: hypothetical protein VLB49_10970 [Gemmatimonadales bacterium]|nr:hypothetical protein [Gemmatimonadales bacterium]
MFAPLTVAAIACGRAPSLDTRTFHLKYIRAEQARDIVIPYIFADRPDAKGTLSYSASTATITVRETRDNLDKIARVLAQYDVPGPMVRLTFHRIQADGAATADPAIADVEPTLRKLFRFRGYRLVQEGIFSVTEGGNVTQQLGTGTYSVAAGIRRVAGVGDSATVEFGVQLSGRDVRFETQVALPAGKTAVLGNVGESPKGTLILTVKPELISASP